MLEVANPVHSQFVASAARWWVDAGVDVVIDESPVPWLERGKKLTAPVVEAPTLVAPVAKPETLAALVAALMAFPGLDGHVPQSQRVAASGPPGSDLMVMIDMPEAGDVQEGRLLGGDAGELFDAMLRAIKRDRQSCYVAALCPGRPADGVIPQELVPVLASMALDHLRFAAPKRLWLMGQTVSRAMLGPDAMPGRARLQKINHEGAIVEAVASFSPRLLLQNPKRKAAAWADMQELMRGIEA